MSQFLNSERHQKQYEYRLSQAVFIYDALLILVFVGLILIPYHLYIRKTQYYIITESSVICTSGLWVKKKNVYPIESITTLELRQGLLGRSFNYGSIILKTLTGDLTISMIDKPGDFIKHLEVHNSNIL